MAHKPQPLIMRIIGPIVILACLAYTISGSIGQLSKELITHKLDGLSASFAKRAADNGKEGKLSYGDITIEGWGFKKTAVIHNLSLSVSEKGLMDTSKWSLSTASVVVNADAFLEGQLYFTFPDPFNVVENSELKATVNFPKPPKYSYFEGKRNKVRMVEHVLSLPEQISVVPTKPVDDVHVNKTKPMTLTYDPNPIISDTYLTDSKEHNSVIELKNFKLNTDEGARAVATLVSSKFSEKQTAPNAMEGKYSLQFADLLLMVGDSVMKPYNVAVDVSTKSTLGAAPAKEGQAASGDMVATAADITVNQFSIVTSDFDLKLDGTISESLDDPLLYGQANLTIDNVPNFLAGELVSQQARGALSMALEKIAGQPVDTITNLTIPLKREKNSTFYVNNTTFEELATSLFSDLMKEQQQPVDANGQPIPGAAIDTTPVPSTLPDKSPTASAPAGAAPYAPVVTAPVPAPAKPTPAEKMKHALPAAGGQ